jgi:FkbM family methyltransferase
MLADLRAHRASTIVALGSLGGSIWRFRPYVYRLLDRGLLRAFLAQAATVAARRETDADVRILFAGGLWMYRVDGEFFPGEPEFVYRHGNELASLPAYERDIACDLWFHVYEPKPGDVIVDVGAGIGGETHVFATCVGPSGRVLSIEANPHTFARLDARVRWNHLANVTLCSGALVDRSRRVFVQDRREVYERNAVSLESAETTPTLPVYGYSLDELCDRQDIEQISFLKMNIEGGERLALRGMNRMIGRTNAVCIACHKIEDEQGGAIHTRDVVTRFLRKNGFEVVTREDDSRSFVRDHIHGIRLV